MVEGPDHDTVDPAFQVVGNIRDAFAHPEPDPLPQVQGMTTQLVQPCLKCHPRPQTLLLEDQRDVASGKWLGRMAPRFPKLSLQLRGRVEDPLVLCASQIGRTE